MAKQVLRALLMLLTFTLLCGLAYPLAVTGLARLCFPGQARGSFIARGGKMIGSTLIGQRFDAPGYFHGRPSAAGASGYDATASGGSNLGPTNKNLITSVGERAARIRNENSLPDGTPVPGDFVTTSASGLDPHISPEAALLQASRVAEARKLSEAKVRALVKEHVEEPQLGFLGARRVNVLRLNLALDALSKGGIYDVNRI